MSARTYILDELAARVPASWVVPRDPSLPETMTATTVIVEPATIDRVDGGRSVDASLDTHLILPRVGDRAGFEDRLEDILDELIEVLESIPGLTWTTARRLVLSDTYHAYSVTLNIRMGKE